MTSGYKKPGILRASFDYQDFAAIQLLIDFYRQPDLYSWIELDSDDASYASIDDLVACRSDGRFEITQVKFTVDPSDPANELSWDWLLKKTKKGRSLLEKWSGTVLKHVEADSLERAELFTDRLPEASFAQALDGLRISPRKVTPAVWKKLMAQLGSAEKIERFFEHFHFRHSQPHFDDFEYQLQARLIPSDTDYAGWIALVRMVKEWATFKQRPEPDGRVRHSHIRAVISRDRAKPLQQNFEIPHGYRPPDEAFDALFCGRVLNQDGVSVLWGTPGRGKSTYLSHCFTRMVDAKQICIRHHYFLSLTERGTARFFFQDIERSLIRQIEEHFPNLDVKGQTLAHWLDAGAKRAGEKGRRLVVMIDGLDHVWREGRSLDHMQQVFAHLLPPRAYMHLVVGTQKIAAKHLPHRLIQYCPEEEWYALPVMTPTAIQHWLSVQHAAGRLTLDPQAIVPKALLSLAAALHKVTGGLPLQLIYAFETLTRPGGAIEEAAVYALPSQPTGDIRDYYASLWKRISASARAILHALAHIDFAMPPGSLHQCFHNVAGVAESIEEIDHLLDHKEIGIYPFHGSIFVFVRDQPDHVVAATIHAKTILDGLDHHAPEYWKWAWTGITTARFGDPADLRAGPTRAWALEALRAGQPPEQIEHILRESEALAFEVLDFGRTSELRSLWIRLSNAPEFQTNRFAEFVESTIRSCDNDYRLLQLRNSLTEQAPDVMIALLRSLAPEAAKVAANHALNELNRRARDSRYDDHSRVDWAVHLVRVLPYLEDFDPQRLKSFAKRAKRLDNLIGIAAEEAILAERYTAALGFAALHRGPMCDTALFNALCIDGADPRAHPELKGHASLPKMHALYAVRGWSLPARRPLKIDVGSYAPPVKDPVLAPETPPRLQGFFFRVLSASLGGRAARVQLTGLDDLNDEWVRGVMFATAAAAYQVAARLDAGDLAPSIDEFFAMLPLTPRQSQNYDAQRVQNGVRLGLRDIAIDLQLLRRAKDPDACIEPRHLLEEDALRWHDEIWLEYFVTKRLPLHSLEAAEAIIERIAGQLEGAVSEFMERSDLCIQTALFALDHGLANHATAFLKRAARCLLGYGWRKDPACFELLEALELMATVDEPWTQGQLRRLAPAFAAITDFTDGDETNHAKSDFYAAFARLMPERAGALYGFLVRSDEWYYADSLIKRLVKQMSPKNAHDRALLMTLIQPDEIAAVKQLAKTTKTGASVVAKLDRLVGYSKRDAPKKDDNGDRFLDRAPRTAPKPAEFPPPRLEEFQQALRKASGYGWKDRAMERWLDHWYKQGQGREALAAMRHIAKDEDAFVGVEKIYDAAFAISLELEGRQAAFSWLIAAQRFRHGWGRWYSSSHEAGQRLSLAATHYRERWPEFVTQSAVPVMTRAGERSALVLGQSRLVDFLLRVGELERARELTTSLADTMIAEVEDQPLSIPEWL